MSIAAPAVSRRLDRSDLVVGIAALGAAGFLIWLGRGLTFFADEWSLIADRSRTVTDLLVPFNEHWLAVTIVVYRSMLALFGMHSYVPFLVLVTVLHVTVAILVYALVRRRTIRPVAMGVAFIVLLFGSGFENLFWGIQIAFVGATALGLAAMLLLDDVPTSPGFRRAAAGSVLLTIGIMTSGYGLLLLAFVGFDLLLDPRRRHWIVLLLIPAIVYATWYLAFGRSGIATHGDPFTVERAVAVPRMIVDGMASALGAASGGGALAGRVVMVGVAARLGYLLIRRQPIPTRALACLLAIATEYLIVGLVRVQLPVDASLYTRYTYLSGILALIAAASLVGRPAISRPARPIATALGLAILTVSLSWNIQLLVAGRDLYAERADLTRALVSVGTTDPLPAGVGPERSLGLVPSPTELHRLIEAYGTPLGDVVAVDSVPAISLGALGEATRRALNPTFPPTSMAGS